MVRLYRRRLGGFAKPSRPVAGVNRERLPAAVHLSVYLRIAKASFHGHRNGKADVAIIGAGINVGPQVSGENYVDAAVAGPDSPTARQLRARFHTRVDAAVAGLYV